MKLATFKRKTRYTVTEMADAFGVSHQTMYNWIKLDATISGKKGQRVITLPGVTKPQVGGII